jgi:hypothetical protein
MSALMPQPRALSNSLAGTMAGLMIMQGFVGFTIPLWDDGSSRCCPSCSTTALAGSTEGACTISWPAQ